MVHTLLVGNKDDNYVTELDITENHNHVRISSDNHRIIFCAINISVLVQSLLVCKNKENFSCF